MIKRIKESLAWRYWARKYPDVPTVDEFQTKRSKEELQGDASGPMAELFYSMDAEPVWKWTHYLPVYDTLFGPLRGTDVKFLEIGVFKGGSLTMWREWFGKDATIFGIDIDPECAQFDGRAGEVRIGSQDDPEFLARVVEEMGGVDVVLDDGSHFARHQRASFETLFPLLADGGLYVIEDMHTAYWPLFEGGLRRQGTAVELLKDQVDRMHQQYIDRDGNRPDKMAPIESVQFFDSIGVVRKRQQRAREVVMMPRPE